MAPTCDLFERPVITLTRFGVPTAISSAMEAYMFLADWPVSERDAVHTVAVNGCLAGLKGEIEIETARGLFAAWAERQDILAPNAAAFVSTRGGRSHGAP